ncbi:MAG: UDP-3-O-(3-hydroxymyristoyl)glucosamine N-acyltransferase [bacterium]|nr:UDP-3-O-(3-hydroxymyristoyl)glucosamine N-acyltransferase [bacterium]
MTLKELAKRLNLDFHGDENLVLTHLSGFEEISAGALAFLMDSKALPTPGGVFNQKQKDLAQVAADQPCAVIVPLGTEARDMNLIWAADPLAAHCQAANILQSPPQASGKIHPRAWVDPSAQIGENVTLDAGVVVYEGAQIGQGSVLRANVVVMAGARLGEDCLIYPNVTIREGCQLGDRVILHAGVVIGADGYGYYQREGKNHKIPQVGVVVLESDVEIGANSCVDRARFSQTRIGANSKLDNLVHIAHNVEVGAESLITAQSGIAGSTKTGTHLMMGGQSGIRDNLSIGNRVTLLARTLVTAKAQDGETLAGMPGRAFDKWRHQQASLAHLDRLLERIKALEEWMQHWRSTEPK